MASKSHKSKKQKAAPLPRNYVAQLLHPQSVSETTWYALPWLLGLAFVLRAAVALSGDFVIHPDEIMQYMEQAHRLVFGSGVVYWEYFYGARSWLVPGTIAAVLWLCNLIGLSSPVYYIAVVKLFFCLLSLLVPWGMYMFSRRHWNENTARAALIIGVFWYELLGFAHKPLTEFIATSLLFLLLAFMPLANSTNWRKYALAGALGAFIIAIRFQYIPAVGLAMLAIFWVGSNKMRLAMIGGGVAVLALIAILETVTWGAPFHSYYVNAQMNLIVGGGRAGESSIVLFPLLLLLASGGLILAAAYSVFDNFRRRGFVLLLILMILLPHMLQHHREYRFIFAVIPLWLLLFADYIMLNAERHKKLIMLPKIALGLVSFVSIVGIFNLIPLQEKIYKGFSQETGRINFIRGQDKIFDVYRLLSKNESVRGVVDFTRPYFNSGGYYYLGWQVPFYDRYSWGNLAQGDIASHVSHIITDKKTDEGRITAVQGSEGRIIPSLQTDTGPVTLPTFAYNNTDNELAYWGKTGQKTSLANYKEIYSADNLTLWEITEPVPVREWKNYAIMAAFGLEEVMEIVLGDKAPLPPPQYGVEFVE